MISRIFILFFILILIFFLFVTSIISKALNISVRQGLKYTNIIENGSENLINNLITGDIALNDEDVYCK